MVKRYRTPRARPGQLKCQWGKLDGREDIIYIGGEGVPRWDQRLVHNIFTSQHKSWDNEILPDFLTELEERGYDLKTLKFSIEKKRGVLTDA